MELDMNFPLDGLSGLDDLINPETFDSFPFLGVETDLETAQTKQQVAEKMEGIHAHDLSSLLEQFEEASQSSDGIDFPKAEMPLIRSKSLPASKVCSATSSPAYTPLVTPPPCVLDKIRARQGHTAKCKSTIMLPMGAPAKRSWGKATMLEIPATLSGSSKLQRILSRNNLCPALSQSQTAGGKTTKQTSVSCVNSGVVQPRVVLPANARPSQSGVCIASSSVPVTVFSSQPVLMGSNVAHPVPVILSAVGTAATAVGGQQSFPLQLLVASTGQTVGSVWLDTSSSANSAPMPNLTATLGGNIASIAMSKSSKPAAAKPPPLNVKKTLHTYFTTVNTRAEGIPAAFLDSVMDHDYCANSPRRVTIDEFELNLSPTMPLHKVKSLPIIKTDAAREVDRKNVQHPRGGVIPEASAVNKTDADVSVKVSLPIDTEALPVQRNDLVTSVAPEVVAASSVKKRNKTPVLDPRMTSKTAAKPSQSVKQVPERNVPKSLPSKGYKAKPAVSLPTEGNGGQQKSVASACRIDTSSEKGGKAKHKVDTCSSELKSDPQLSSHSVQSEGKAVLDIDKPDVQKNPECETQEKPESSLPEKEAPVLLSMPLFDDDEVPNSDTFRKVVAPVACSSRSKNGQSKTWSNEKVSDSMVPPDSDLSSNTEYREEEEETSEEKNLGVDSAEPASEENSDTAMIPHSPVRLDEVSLHTSSSETQSSSQTAGEVEGPETYTEEDLAQADRERFIPFEEEEEKAVSSSHSRGKSRRGNRRSRQIRKWRPGNSPVKEDSNNFFNKIPSYYTVLSKPTKTGRKQLTADGIEGMSFTDFIPDRSPTHKSSSSTYSKLPAYHSCFTNSTKYDHAATDEVSCHGSDYDGSKPVYSFDPDNFEDARHSRSKSMLRSRSCSRSRSKSRDRSTSQGRSRKRVRSVSSSDSSRSRSGSCHQSGRKHSRRSHSSVSGSSCNSSASRSCSSSRSSSRSPSMSHRRRPGSAERAFRRQQKQKDKIRKMEERKIVYVGRIPENYTRKDLRRRFERFGKIEKVSVHFREAGDNYGFVTFYYTCDAYTAIDKGNNDPNELQFDLCFGGRRHFCANDYADLDGNLVLEEEYTPMAPKDPVGFDELLKQAQQKLKKKY